MSDVSSSELNVSFDYASGLDKKFIDYAPSSIKDELRSLWTVVYGAYIFQAPGDPTVCAVGINDTFSTYEVSEVITDVITKVKAAGDYSPHVIEGMDMYILSSLSFRVQGEASKLTVASLIKYLFTVLQIRSDARKEDAERELSSSGQPKTNVDWLRDADERNFLFQDRIPKRELLALAYIGAELHQPLLKEDRDQVDYRHDYRTRMWKMFESVRFKSYKQFVFDKSTSNIWNASSWLKAKACKVVMTSPVEFKSKLIVAIGVYTDSMRTSTTGSIISSPTTVFAPKNVEGDRLITNLFKYHLPQVLDGEYAEDLKTCVEHLEVFLRDTSRRNVMRV